MDQEEAPTNGYGLRENPRNTRRRLSSSDIHHDGVDVDKQQRQCRDCGKLFRSWQALFGHMRCHSHRRNNNPPDLDSWSSTTVPKRKRMPRSSPPEYEEEEQVVDVAISLMILSRDIGFWTTTFNSDKNSAVLVDLIKKKKKKSSRYECATCNKSFHSHQALGGHRSAHKRGGGCLGDSGSSEADAPIDDRTDEDGGKAKGGHQCGICRKVFASGQALGGHMRTHLVIRSPATVSAAAIEEEEAMAMPELLDLNFPAPVDEDSSAAADAEFESWWAGSSLESEQKECMYIPSIL